MRDALLLLVILAGLLVTLRFPFLGLIMWAWFALMTPHQMAYGVFGLQLNSMIAAVTLISVVINIGKQQFRFDAMTGLLIVLAGWMFVAQYYSLDPANSAVFFDRFIKLILFVLLCVQLASSKLRVHALLWMLVLGVGYFGAKGALFTLTTLGQYRVQGIEHTVLEDNNHLGIALATMLPLILYLRGQAAHKRVRQGMLLLFLMCCFSVLGTQSRGAFISLIAFAGFFWWRSKHKASIFAALCLLAIPAIAFMPSSWTERMSTIGEATQDESFMGRVDAWIINYKTALANPITGAGLRNPYQEEIAFSVDPERAENAKAAHSIYLEMLGGSGFVGLAIYLAILATAFLQARRLAHPRAGADPPQWARRFGYYAQISLVVFGVGGASTSLEMWDGYWIVIALVAAVRALVAASAAAPENLSQARNKVRPWRAKARGRSLKTPKSILH